MSISERPFVDYESWEEILSALSDEERRLEAGGGEAAVDRQHEKGRLAARERIGHLVDPGTEFFELSLFAGHGMYGDWGEPPAAGLITGVGRVSGRLQMIVANDATVKAGSFFPITVKKLLRAQTIAQENRLPLIYLVDSAGVFLPLQDEIFPDQDDFGRIFRNNARLSAAGIPQTAAIMGPCVAGGAYLPVMSDKILMTEGSGLFIAGPSLVKAAIGQDLNSEELGGAELHSSLSGTIDFREKDDESCLKRIRHLVSSSAPPKMPRFQRSAPADPAADPERITDRFPLDPSAEYDVRDLFSCIVDAGDFTEYKEEYGRTVVCGYARIGGWSVGIVANQRQNVREAGRPFEVGGVLYRESADKAARFIMDCNQNLIPLVFFQDVNGFMVGRQAEISGIIKSGAKLVNAVANSVVPKITVIIGGSFGAGNYALCGKAYDPRFIFGWPTCRYAVMGGDQAAKTLADLKVRQLAKQGRTLSDREREDLEKSISETYSGQMDARYAAARLWLDKIIYPAETRDAVALALEVASLDPEIEEFRTGVLQV